MKRSIWTYNQELDRHRNFDTPPQWWIYKELEYVQHSHAGNWKAKGDPIRIRQISANTVEILKNSANWRKFKVGQIWWKLKVQLQISVHDWKIFRHRYENEIRKQDCKPNDLESIFVSKTVALHPYHLIQSRLRAQIFKSFKFRCSIWQNWIGF